MPAKKTQKMKVKPGKVLNSVRISAETTRRINDYADDNGMKKEAVFEAALISYLDAQTN